MLLLCLPKFPTEKRFVCREESLVPRVGRFKKCLKSNEIEVWASLRLLLSFAFYLKCFVPVWRRGYQLNVFRILLIFCNGNSFTCMCNSTVALLLFI